MKKTKVYFYPSCPKDGYGNPYCLNFKEVLKKYFELLDASNKITRMKSMTLLIYSFKADLFILNWIENTIYLRFGFIQFCLVFLSFFVIGLRKKKIVWIFHNVIPHEGDNFFTRIIMTYLFKHSKLIISHSKEACAYAESMAHCKVTYCCHPIKRFNVQGWHGKKTPCDILIWGTILPYKGILEFLRNCSKQLSNVNILILGKCKDNFLAESIKDFCSEHMFFENRRAEFNEIEYYIRTCRYVLFPYIGESVSSSGVLMDTIAMGGTPIGPSKGAFKDLREDGLCKTYNSYEELLSIINSRNNIDKDLKEKFIEENTWNSFIVRLSLELD